MVDEHLQKGERKMGHTQAQSPDWKMDVQMPQHLVRWGWRFRAVRRMAEGFCGGDGGVGRNGMPGCRQHRHGRQGHHSLLLLHPKMWCKVEKRSQEVERVLG